MFDYSTRKAGDSVRLLNNDREIVKVNLWATRALTIIIAIVGMVPGILAKSPVRVVGNVIGVAILYWIFLRILSSPADSS